MSSSSKVSDLPRIAPVPSDKELASRKANSEHLIKIKDTHDESISRTDGTTNDGSGSIDSSNNNNNNNKTSTFGADELAKKFQRSKKHLGAKLNSNFKHWRERIFFKEFMIYTAFLVIFVGVSLSARPSGYAYWFTETVRDQFTDEEFTDAAAPNLKKTFLDVGSDGEFWDWLEGPLLGNLYPTDTYNGSPLSTDASRYVLGSLRRIGAVRLRQLRVKKGSDCKIPPKFGDVITNCAGGYSGGNEDELPFGPSSDPEKYKWSSRSDLNGVFTWGFVETYGGSGYVVTLPDNADGAAAVVSTLKNDGWVDQYTRAVFLEFTLYNPNVNLWCVSSMLVEFPVSGGAFPNPTFRVVRLFRYQFVSDYVRLVFELIFVLFVFYFLIEEAIEFKDQGWEYLKVSWNYFDMLNLLLFLVVIIIRIVQIYKEGRLPIEDLQQPGGQDTFISFQDVAWFAQQEVNVNSVNAFLCWFKIFKYVKMSKRLSQLSRTLARASVDIVNFLLMFMVVFLGYAHMGYMIFGTDIHGYRNYGVCLITLFRGVMGDFDFEAANASNRFLGPIFYISFMVLVFMVLLNMFLAIINAAYTIVTTEDEERESLLNFAGFFKESRDVIVAKLPWSKAKANKVSQQLDDAEAEGTVDKDKDGVVDRSELRAILEGQNDVEDIMARYDLDKDGALNQQEYDMLREELRARGAGIEIDETNTDTKTDAGDNKGKAGAHEPTTATGSEVAKRPPRLYKSPFTNRPASRGHDPATELTMAKIGMIEGDLGKITRQIDALASTITRVALSVDKLASKSNGNNSNNDNN